MVTESFAFPSGLVFEVHDFGRRVVSIFPDGVICEGVADFGAEHVARARSLGYIGSDEDAVLQLTRHHDLLHHVVAVAAGWPWSVVLRHAALDLPLAAAFGNQEERMVFLLQRALNTGLPGLLP